MIKYIFKRLLFFLPTLFAISLLAFWLGKVAPGDPVETRYPIGESAMEVTGEAYEEVYEDMGLNKPLFYIGLSSKAYPDTLHKVRGRYRQESLSKLIDQYGNWEKIEDYDHRISTLYKAIENLPEEADENNRIEIHRSTRNLLESYKDPKISSYLNKIETIVLGDSLLQAEIGGLAQGLIKSYQEVKNNPTRTKALLPSIKWYGFDNQYHHWVTAFVQGDFGLSYQNKEPVLDRIKTPISWTLIINSIVIFLIYILAVPLGVFSAVKKDSRADKFISTGLFFLYSLPSFWIATMLLVFFTNPEYGMNWFEGAGLGNLPSDAPFWNRFWETAAHLILPVFCITYGSLAFMSRQMRGSMLEVLNEDYIRTAKAKGLKNSRVIWKHSFRNALFPLITLFATVFPAAIAGSVVVETIFNIPGMGREVIQAIHAKDWPVLYTILMLVAILTMLGNLVADILYALVDPRVKFN